VPKYEFMGCVCRNDLFLPRSATLCVLLREVRGGEERGELRSN